jgi:two-component system cell cycle sensor histidine kinase/response regulator CckA
MNSFAGTTRRVAQLAGIFVLLAGITVLAGWQLDIEPLKSVVTGGIGMSPLTALAFVFAGAALYASTLSESRAGASRLMHWTRMISAGTVLLISSIKLAVLISGSNFPIDGLIFGGQRGETNPAVMSPATAGSFLLFGLALLLPARPAVMPLFQTLTFMGGLAGWLGLNFFLFGGESFIPFAQMAAHTALLLLVLSAGILSIRTDGGLMALLTSESLGGLMARRLIPAALILPIVLRWLRMKGQLAGLYSSQAGWSLLTLALMLAFGGLVWAAAVLLNRVEEKRRAAEASLRSGQELLQAVADGSLAVIYVKDLDGKYLLVNRRYEEVFHVRRDEMAGKTDYDLFSKESADAFRAVDRQVATTGAAVEAEEVAPHDDGPHTYFSIKCPLRDSSGKVSAVCGISTDITERKRAEDALRQSDARTRAMIDAALDAIIAMDESGLIREFNPAAEKIFEYRREETIGRPLADLIIPSGLRDAHRRALAHYLATGEGTVLGKRIEVQGCRADGTEVPLELSISRAPGDGPPMFTGFARDITDRKQAEEAVRASEERFRTMADSAPVLIWISGLDKRCTWFNRQWLEFVGHTLEKELDDGWSESVHPDDISHCVSTFTPAFEERRAYSLEYRLRRHDGQWRWVFDKAIPLYRPGGEFVGYIGSCVDITERKHLEDQLHHARKMEAVGRLAGGIAHDFNNLLTAINGYADLTLDGLFLGNPLRDGVENIRKAGEKAAALTRQLLAFGRRQVVETKVLNVNEVVENNAKILSRVIGEDIQFVTTLDRGLKAIKTDPGQIEQILMNLAVNARDAMPQGGKLTIETRNVHLDDTYAEQHAGAGAGDYVMIAVTDSGCGMDAETQAQIFEPFFTTKDVGKGTGLGLSIVYGIVKQNKGNIWVYSEPGKGTTFKLYFPQVEELPVVASNNSPLSLVVAAHAETILVVEDDDIVRQLVCAVLQKGGYQTINARNGAEALEICKHDGGRIGLVLSDLVMPEMSGPALIAQLSVVTPGLKALHMSGYASDAVVRHGYVGSSIPFIQKPFSATDLLQKVRDVLESSDPNGATAQ